MIQSLWLNLPVKDVKRSKAFFTALGFSFNPNYGDSDESTCLMVGEKQTIVMLFAEPSFKNFTSHPVADTQLVSEVLLSFDLESKEAVDALFGKVEAAGGTIFKKPGGNEWMYGGGFCDPDGHRWNPLYMDMSKMPKG